MGQSGSWKQRFRDGSGTSDFLYSLASRVAIVVFAIAVQSLLAWTLGPEGRGEYAVCLVFATVLGVASMLSSDIAGTYFVSSDRFSLTEGASCALALCAAGSVVALAAGRALMELDIAFFQKAPHEAFLVALLLIPVLQLSRVLLLLLTAVRRFRWYALMTGAHFAGHALWLLALFLVWGGSVSGALWANVARCLFTVGLIWWLLRRSHGLRLVRPTLVRCREMAGYAVRYHAGKLCDLTNAQVGTILLAFFVPVKEIGIFAVASQFLTKTMVVPDAMMTFLLPRVSREGEGSKRMVLRLMLGTGAISVVFLSALCLLASWAVRLLFSASFLEAVPLIWIIAPGAAVRSTVKVAVPYLLGIGRPGIVSLSTICSVAVNALLLVLLLPTMGLAGAAWAMAASFVAGSLVLAAGFARCSPAAPAAGPDGGDAGMEVVHGE